MIPSMLSLAGPLSVYATLVVLACGLWRERKKLEWFALVPAIVGLMASLIFLPPIHRLFFDEDIYISMATNLTKAPLARITMLGGPNDIEESVYYKEPSGWPVLLSFFFLLAGPSEAMAFLAARLFFALTL